MSENSTKMNTSDIAYLLRSLAHMRGEILTAQETVRVLSDQLETWRTWHEDIEQDLVRILPGIGTEAVDQECPPNMKLSRRGL